MSASLRTHIAVASRLPLHQFHSCFVTSDQNMLDRRQHMRHRLETLRRLVAALVCIAFLAAVGPMNVYAFEAGGADVCAGGTSDFAQNHARDCDLSPGHVGCVGHSGHAACSPFLLPAGFQLPAREPTSPRVRPERDLVVDVVPAPDAPPPKLV